MASERRGHKFYEKPANPVTEFNHLPTSAFTKRRARDRSSQFCVWYPPNTLPTLFSGYWLHSTHTHTRNYSSHPEKLTLDCGCHKLAWTLGTKSCKQEIKYYSIGGNMRGRGRGKVPGKGQLFREKFWDLGWRDIRNESGVELLQGDLPREKPKQLSVLKQAVFQEVFLCPDELPYQHSSQLNADFATDAKPCDVASIQKSSGPCDACWWAMYREL